VNSGLVEGVVDYRDSEESLEWKKGKIAPKLITIVVGGSIE
jgi:hypothetical protein